MISIPTAALALLALSAPALAADITGPVTHVRDGDTMVVGRQPVRICGIDTPERGRRGAKEATAEMKRIAFGKTARCVPVDEGTPCDGRSQRRSRDRIVAQCFVGAVDIARILVSKRLACDWPKFSGGTYGGPGVCQR